MTKKFRHMLTILVAAILVIGAIACGVVYGDSLKAEAATSGSCGTNVTWNISGGTLTISGSGDMMDYSAPVHVPWDDYRDKITRVSLSSDITRIGEYCFSDFTELSSITLGSSVTRISSYAFKGCSNLKSVYILSESLEIIYTGAFSGCDSLLNVYYSGSQSEWNSITIQSMNWCLTDANITYSYSSSSTVYLSGISVYKMPNKTEYRLGDSVDESGLVIKLTYSDGSTSYTSTGFYCSPNKFENMGTQRVTVNYGDKRCYFDVTVKNKVVDIVIKSLPIKREYILNEQLDTDGLILEITYYDGTVETVSSGFSCLPDVLKNFGTNEITVSYDGVKCNSTFDVTVDCAMGFCGAQGDNLKWVLDSEGNLAVSGTGAMANYSITDNAPWYDSVATIKTVTVSDGVTSVGDYAFYNCHQITNADISRSVTSIGENAFYECRCLKGIAIAPENPSYSSDESGVLFDKNKTELIQYPSGNTVTSYKIPDSVTNIRGYAFNRCKALAVVEIPTGVTNIGKGAFYNCIGLTSVTIGDGVTSIGDYAFYGCTGITSVAIDDGKTSIGDYAFRGCTGITSVTIGDGETVIGEYAFYCCTGITSVAIGDGETSIGQRSFYGCTGAESIIIGDGETSIGGFAFYGCTGLESIIIGDGEISIGNYAFYGCEGVECIVIGDGITSIGEGSFYGCAKIKDLTMPASATFNPGSFDEDCTGIEKVTLTKGTGIMTDYVDWQSGNVKYTDTPWYGSRSSIKEVIFEDGITNIGSYAFRNCEKLTNIEIPDSVTSIGDYAFHNCAGLVSVEIPDGVENIGEGVFHSCTGLTNVIFPDSIKSIGNYAFCNCRGIASIEIPDSVTSIGDYAFHDCDGFVSVELPDCITSVGKYAFYGCDGMTSLKIPDDITSIGDCAFKNCSGIGTVYYGGNKSQWSYVAIGDENAELTEATIIYGSDSKRPYYDCGTCGENLTWFFYADDVLVIFGTGDMENFENSSVPWNKYIAKIKSVVISDGITSIGNYAFSGCTGVTSIEIPDSVTNIGNYSFSNCTGLLSIEIPDSVTNIGNYSFSNCTGLLSIEIPDSVTSIGNRVFINCTGLKSVTISDGVKSMGDAAFSGCTGIKELTIPVSISSRKDSFSGCTGIEKAILTKGTGYMSDYISSSSNGYAGNKYTPWYISRESLKEIVIEDGVRNIGDSAFSGCELINVTIPSSVTSIGENALRCENVYYTGDITGWCKISFKGIVNGAHRLYFNGVPVTDLIIPDGVTSIRNNAFYGCTDITSIEIPDSVTSIGERAFSGCGITSIEIPDSVTSIGRSAFSGCTELREITIPVSSSMPAQVNWSADALFTGCTRIEKVTLTKGNGVMPDFENSKYMYTPWFVSGDSIKEIIIQDGVTNIGVQAFRGCEKLGNITIPDSVTSIGGYAFWRCTELTNIEIPDSVTSIGEDAFSGCTRLEYIHIPASVTEIGARFLDNTQAYICSDTEDCYAKIYADANGIEFRVCKEQHIHSYVETITKQPTCTETGVKTFTCECNDSYTEILPVLGHTAGKWEIVEEASCMETGKKIKKCTVCKKTVETEILPVLGHTAGEWETVKEPTETEDGKRVKYCTVCTTPVEEEIIPKHDIQNATDIDSGISMEFNANNFNGTVGIQVSDAQNSVAAGLVQNVSGSDSMQVHGISMTVNGVVTQPEETITLKLPVPEGYEPETSKVYSVNPETNTVEEISAEYENGYFVFETDVMDYFAIVQIKNNSGDNGGNEDENEDGDKSEFTMSLKKPTVTTIKYGDNIILHADIVGTLPDGATIQWFADNGNFEKVASNDGKTCRITPKSSGNTTFTVKVVSADGEVLAEDEQVMTSKAGLFDKIIGFFKKLFGLTKIIAQAVKFEY